MGDPDTMFASRSIGEHLLRGAVGLPLMVCALVLTGTLGPLSLLMLVPAVALLRGCPTCWALGLAQTCERTRCSTGRC